MGNSTVGTAESAPGLLPAGLAGRLRLWSGLLMFTYVTTHLVNHALGLISLPVLESGRLVFLAFWRWPPVQALLIGALAIHVGLTLARLWTRRSLRMPLIEAVQITLGLLIPTYLVLHVLGTGVLHRCCGLDDTYTYYIDLIWPDGVGGQTLMLLIVWLHGCLGIRAWLRLEPGYLRARPVLLTAAVLLPTLALLGFIVAGREIDRLRVADPAALTPWLRQEMLPDQATRQAFVYGPEAWITNGFLLIVAAILLARLVRSYRAERAKTRITFDDGQVAIVPPGFTVLDASRAAGIPHASVCGGRGRCSTCRVRVLAGAENLDRPGPTERKVLERINAGANVRLACQIRPRGAITVSRLMSPTASTRDVLRMMDPGQGRERDIAVLFADLRAFTQITETRLPYDTVYLLNRYFRAMGTAIEEAGGRVDKFIGDGIMALFGLDDPPEHAARNALAGARGMFQALDRLNAELAAALPKPLRMGIGVHLGHAIVGEMGYGRAVGLTAVGDTVNVASRLEALTKELAVPILASASVVEQARLTLNGSERREVDLRGRAGRLPVYLIRTIDELPAAQPAPRARSWWERVLARAKAP